MSTLLDLFLFCRISEKFLKLTGIHGFLTLECSRVWQAVNSPVNYLNIGENPDDHRRQLVTRASLKDVSFFNHHSVRFFRCTIGVKLQITKLTKLSFVSESERLLSDIGIHSSEAQ